MTKCNRCLVCEKLVCLWTSSWHHKCQYRPPATVLCGSFGTKIRPHTQLYRGDSNGCIYVPHTGYCSSHIFLGTRPPHAMQLELMKQLIPCYAPLPGGLFRTPNFSKDILKQNPLATALVKLNQYVITCDAWLQTGWTLQSDTLQNMFVIAYVLV